MVARTRDPCVVLIDDPHHDARGTDHGREESDPMESATLDTVELLQALPDQLVDVLARLHEQPEGVAEAVLSTLRYGSRATLAEAEVIERVPGEASEGAVVQLTTFGRRFIATCARARELGQQDERRAEAALASAHAAWEQRHHDIEEDARQTSTSATC
jgi:hypothetical protein